MTKLYGVIVMSLATATGFHGQTALASTMEANPLESEPVMAFVAASTGPAVARIAERFTKETGIRVTLNPAATPVLAQQILADAPCDVFLSANESWVDKLAAANLVAERVDRLSNRLALIVPLDPATSQPSAPGGRSINRLTDLTRDEVEHISIADPETVPAGIHAREALTRLGLWHRVKGKVVPSEDVRAALTFVERGEVDAGIVYTTDAMGSKKVHTAETIDPSLHTPIRYPLVLLKRGSERPEARRFFDYLKSEKAELVFTEFGFGIAAPISNR